MTPNQSHIAELEQVIGLIDLVEHQPPVLDQARRILVKLVAMIEQAKAAPAEPEEKILWYTGNTADPTDAVEIVGYWWEVTGNYFNDCGFSADELAVESLKKYYSRMLGTLLEEPLMTVAQHKRLMAAKDGDVVKVPRELLERAAKPVLFKSRQDSHYDACAELRALLGGAG